MIRTLLAATALAAAVTLSGCATPPTVYQAAAKPTDMGWRETRIEATRYRVSFRANADVGRAGAEDRALRRAAEITTREGYDWFRVVSRSTDTENDRRSGGSSVGIGGSSGSFGSSVGVGVGFDLSPDSRQYDATFEILLGKGTKPADADAYDARSVLMRPMQ